MTFKPHHEFVAILERYGVPFCIVGGHAVQAHGFGRDTEDIDIVWLRTDESEERLLSALRDANACWISSERDPNTGIEKTFPVSARFVDSEHLMMLCTDYGFVDLFDYIPGYPSENVRALLDSADLIGNVRYASLEWLKKMKRAAGRPKDIEDLRNLP